MKNFEYAAPRTEAEVVQLLSPQAGKTEVLAGGTDLMGLMKQMIVTPDRVVNIMEVPTLKTIATDEQDNLVIGAAVTLDEILAHPYLENYPAVTDAILGINSMQLQSQGTLGGEICQRPRCWFFRNGQGLLNPEQVLQGDNRFHAIFGNTGRAKYVHSSRIAPALVALQARLRVVGPSAGKERLMPVADFFQLPRREAQREHVLAPNQLLTHVILPKRTSRWNAPYEVRPSEGPEYPLAAAAADLDFDGFGRVRSARIILGQVAPVPWESEAASRVLVNQTINAEIAEAAGLAAVESAQPLSENVYKVQLTKVAVKRAILLAAGLQTGGF